MTAQMKAGIGGVGQSFSDSDEVTSGAEGWDINGETVADGQADSEINIDIDVSHVKAFYLRSDQDITVEVNDGAGAGGTHDLKANKPMQWSAPGGVIADAYNPFTDLFAVDVTGFFITNASGSTATIYCFVGQDPTP